MYADPSRVLMLARYSARAAEGSPAELADLEGEVRLFIEAAWAEASAPARARFMDAVRRVGPPMPWSAVAAPHFIEAPPPVDAQGRPSLRGPAALELILGQADPEDEGVPEYRIDPQSPTGRRAMEALLGWETETVRTIAEAAGWRLEALERATTAADEDVSEDLSSEVKGTTDDGRAGAPTEGPARVSPWWGIAGGLGLLGAIGVARRLRQE